MLLGDQLDRAPEHLQIVDVGGIGRDGRRQGLLLPSGRLVGGVEIGRDLGIVGEHAGVEVSRQRLPMLLQDGRRSLDDGDSLLAWHKRTHNVYLRHIFASRLNMYAQGILCS